MYAKMRVTVYVSNEYEYYAVILCHHFSMMMMYSKVKRLVIDDILFYLLIYVVFTANFRNFISLIMYEFNKIILNNMQYV